MRAISLFSGIGGLDYGFQLAGVETVLQVENDPWCQAVLCHHWPGVERFDDICKMDPTARRGRRRDVERVGAGSDAERLGAARRRRNNAHGAGDSAAVGTGRSVDTAADGISRVGAGGGVDLVYGGFPCQDVSVAGKRAGLSGERSGLWFEFQRIVSVVRPQWVVIENVPGLLSSHRGRDMATVLGGLGELGYGWAYRVLDARWFGVPQRRRRVFIVGCLGDAARAAQVLAVCESCGGNPQARHETGQDVAVTLAGGSPETSRRIGNDWNTTYLASLNNGQGEPNVSEDGSAFALQADAHNYVLGNTLGRGGHSTNPLDETLLVAGALRASDGHRGHSSPRGDGADNLLAFHMTQDPISTPECRTALGGNAYVGVAAFDDRNQHVNLDVYHTLNGEAGMRSDVVALRSDASRDGEAHTPSADAEGRVRLRDPGFNVYAESPTLDSTGPHSVAADFGVRRLTPLECERLQGFPDGWTDVSVDGKPIADSHRYRMLGNAVATVVAQWLGHRLVAVGLRST